MLPVAIVLGAQRAVAFLSTTLGQVLGFGLLAAALFAVGDWRGSARERAACEVTTKAMIAEGERLAKERDARARTEAKTDADRRIAALQKVKDELQQKVTGYETELAKGKGRRSCIATPVDERGMHGL